jgi:hypothetical protein
VCPRQPKPPGVDGFFADGALLLIHDAGLRQLLDDWVADLDEQEFVAVLPLIRRTFGSFSPSQRRSIAGRVTTGRISTGNNTGGRDVDELDSAGADGSNSETTGRVADGAAGGEGPISGTDEGLDLQLAAAALATVALILGPPPAQRERRPPTHSGGPT